MRRVYIKQTSYPIGNSSTFIANIIQSAEGTVIAGRGFQKVWNPL